jgi:hypothetical protein
VSSAMPMIIGITPASYMASTGGTFTIQTAAKPPPTISDTCPANLPNTPNPSTFADGHDGTASLTVPPGETPGTYKVCVQATNERGTINRSFTISLNQAPLFTSANTATVTAGTDSQIPVTTSGWPTPSITSRCPIPPGITFTDQGNGTATVTVTNTTPPGDYTLCLQAANGINPNATQNLTIHVVQAPAFTSPDTATVRARTDSQVPVTTSGWPTPSITNTCPANLPPSITFTDQGNGTATVTVTNTTPPGNYTLCLQAANGVNPNATQNLTIKVRQ